jgi:hypothetical protein
MVCAGALASPVLLLNSVAGGCAGLLRVCCIRRGPGGGGRAGPWKLAGCVDLEPLARSLTGRRSPGSGSHRR